jgi:serine/threonine protein kinase
VTVCPPPAELLALVEGDLGTEQQVAIESHIAMCQRCSTIAGELVGLAPEGGGPQQFGRFQLERVLGRGAMGVVWAAWDPQLERAVAVKRVHVEHADGAIARARLVREARALARISHPNVVTVHDVGETDGEVFIATELVDGDTLAAMRVPARRWQDVVTAWAQAARGLAAVHAEGLIHRDVKPSNVMVGRDGRVRVADFGLARPDRTEAPTVDPRSLGSARTETGAIAGTPAYMAPEQIAGGSLDGRADQFSLCVALVEALTGKRPVPDAKPALPGMPARLEAALARGLAGDRDARFPTIDELATTLETIVHPRRRVAVIGAGAIALAGIAIAVGLGIHHDGEAASTCRASEAASWRPDDKTAIHAAYGPAGERLIASIDDWLARWATASDASCLATERGAQSPQLLDVRGACLRQQLDVVRAEIDLARHADAELVKQALALPRLDACDDTKALLGLAPLPPPGPARIAIEMVRLRLASAIAHNRVRRFAVAADTARALVPEAEQTHYAPLVGDVHAALGTAELGRGHNDLASDALLAAIAADPGRSDATIAKAYVELVRAMPGRSQSFGFARLAASIIDRSGMGPGERADLDDRVGVAFVLAGHPELATPRFASARTEFTQLHDEIGLLAVALDQLDADVAAGKRVELPKLREIVDLAHRNPGNARLIRSLVGATSSYLQANDAATAAQLVDLLHAIAPDITDDPLLGVFYHHALANLAVIKDDTGTAYHELAAALDIGRKAKIEPYLLYEMACALAQISLVQKDFRATIAYAEYAYGVSQVMPDPYSDVVFRPHMMLVIRASAHLQLGELDDARTYAEKAVQVVEQRTGSTAEELADGHEMLAKVLLTAHVRDRGRMLMQHAIDERKAAKQPEAVDKDLAWLAAYP